MSAYTQGAVRAGWCCGISGCHRMYEHKGRPLVGFGRFLAHRVLRHRVYRLPKWTGVACSATTFTYTAQDGETA